MLREFMISVQLNFCFYRAFSQSGQLDFDIAHDQSMENCAQMLLAAKQLHTQGFFSNDNLSIKNGTGAFVLLQDLAVGACGLLWG